MTLEDAVRWLSDHATRVEFGLHPRTGDRIIAAYVSFPAVSRPEEYDEDAAEHLRKFVERVAQEK